MYVFWQGIQKTIVVLTEQVQKQFPDYTSDYLWLTFSINFIWQKICYIGSYFTYFLKVYCSFCLWEIAVAISNTAQLYKVQKRPLCKAKNPQPDVPLQCLPLLPSHYHYNMLPPSNNFCINNITIPNEKYCSKTKWLGKFCKHLQLPHS